MATSAGVLLFSLAYILILAGDVEVNPGPQLNDNVTTIPFKTLYEKVFDARTNWYNLGLELDVKNEVLKGLDQQESKAEVCLRKMLSHRLETGSPLTWRTLCSALRASIVGRNDVAENIEKWIQDTAQQSSRECPNETRTMNCQQGLELATQYSELNISEASMRQDELKQDVLDLEKTYFNLLGTLRIILRQMPLAKHVLGDYLILDHKESYLEQLSFDQIYNKIRTTLLDIDILREAAKKVKLDANPMVREKIDRAFKAYDEHLEAMLKRRVTNDEIRAAELGEGESELTVKVDHIKPVHGTTKRIKQLVTRVLKIPSHTRLNLIRVRVGSLEATFAISKKSGDTLFSQELGAEQKSELATNNVSLVTYESKVLYQRIDHDQLAPDSATDQELNREEETQQQDKSTLSDTEIVQLQRVNTQLKEDTSELASVTAKKETPFQDMEEQRSAVEIYCRKLIYSYVKDSDIPLTQYLRSVIKTSAPENDGGANSSSASALEGSSVDVTGTSVDLEEYSGDLATMAQQVQIDQDQDSAQGLVPVTLPSELRNRIPQVQEEDLRNLYDVVHGAQRVQNNELTSAELVTLHLQSFQNIIQYEISEPLRARFVHYFSSILADLLEATYPGQSSKDLEEALARDFEAFKESRKSAEPETSN